jgi:hypothetical protein
VPHAPAAPRLSVIDRASVTMMETGMQERSAFLATYVTEGAELSRRGHQVAADVPRGRILRSVLMKPEAELHLDQLHADVLSLATRASRPG